jgi:tetratricopeptide (TPR) repeat protein
VPLKFFQFIRNPFCRNDGSGRQFRARFVKIIFLFALLMASVIAPPAFAQSRDREPPSCLTEIDKAEHRYDLPPGMLISIALVESGRRDAMTNMTTPWAWATQAQGAGHFYDSLDDAMRDVAKLLAADVGLVDVGCMQVDLYHHPHAFPTLRAAFDPETNVDYAARYLVALYRQHGSWPAAIAAYHAGDPADGGDYVARVLYYWKDSGTRVSAALPLPNNPRRRGFVIDEGPKPLDIAAEFFQKKDFAAALAIYRATLDTRPDDQIALLGVAECLRQGGRDEDARMYLERTLTADPHNRTALDSLLRLIDAGPAERKLLRLLSARQVAPDAPQISARLAMVEADTGHLNEAVADMGTAAGLAPDDPIIALDYALLLDRTDNPAAALVAYDRFLRLYRPGSAALTVSLQTIRERQAFLQDHMH